MYPSSALHSILVKSILIICNKIIIFIKLYIPFWLNLYEWRPVPVLGSGRLYIPFWLNLYLSFLSMNSKPKLSLHSILVKSIRGRMPSPERRCVTLHSILVKSILMIRLTMMSRKKLYIPFWLNLYPSSLHNRSRSLITLHSILVKSILTKYTISRQHITLYIPFWLNLYNQYIYAMLFQIIALHSILVKSIRI